MTAETKGRIRHVALSVEDPWETAEFYKQAVGLQEVTELDGPLAEGVFLTDGMVNLAILHFKSDEAAQGTGKDFVGIHHIGFWVDDVVEQGKIVRNAGATWIMGDPNNPNGYEVKHTDLNGIIFDIAAHGWAGSQKNPGRTDNVVHPNPQRRLAKFDERRARAQAKIASIRAKEARRPQPNDDPDTADGKGPLPGVPRRQRACQPKVPTHISPGLHEPQLRPQRPVRIGQPMERDRRIQMMLGVVRHVPHQQPHRRVGQRGARVGQSVAVMRAAGVLGQHVGAQERLADNLRQDPEHQGRLPAEQQRRHNGPPIIIALIARTLRMTTGAACCDTYGYRLRSPRQASAITSSRRRQYGTPRMRRT